MNDTIKLKDKKQTGKRHLFANSVTKVLYSVCRTFKNAYGSIRKRQTTQLKKCLKDMTKEFTEEETRVANKHEKMNNLSDKEENANFLRYHLWQKHTMVARIPICLKYI